jgi:hypothetical protein
MTTYCLVPPFRKAKFCDVPSRVIVKVGCAVDLEMLRNTALACDKMCCLQFGASTGTKC